MSPIHCFVYIFLLLQCTDILAQPAASPAPAGPTNITKILEKAGQFTTLIRLMKQSSVASQIDGQLNNSNSGLTVFAPTDSAFSALPAGTLNSLTDQQKVALVQFHVVPSFLSASQFQTVSNPLRTQAGGTNNGEFPLNITTAGNQVNVSTGVDSTAISGTVYTDNQLAIYQVDKVLLPLSLFGPAAPAPAPGSAGKSKKKSLAGGPSAGGDVPADASGDGWDRIAWYGGILVEWCCFCFGLVVMHMIDGHDEIAGGPHLVKKIFSKSENAVKKGL